MTFNQSFLECILNLQWPDRMILEESVTISRDQVLIKGGGGTTNLQYSQIDRVDVAPWSFRSFIFRYRSITLYSNDKETHFKWCKNWKEAIKILNENRKKDK